MEYLLFTYPNCRKCQDFKLYLKEMPFPGQEFNLVHMESKVRIREFLGQIRRDDKGTIIIPVFVLKENGEVRGVFNSPQELETWLKSKA